MKFRCDETTVYGTKELVNELIGFGANWVFRGQRDSSWSVQSSLERYLPPHKFSEYAAGVEEYFLAKFQSVAHHYVAKDLLPSRKLGWLSLMQHHGVPTRLIDFTESPFIALFFAFDGYSESAESTAIWAIDFTRLDEIAFDVLWKDGKPKEDYRWVKTNRDLVFEQYINGSSHELIWITEPDLYNLRLENQKGTFVLSGRLDKPFSHYLSQERDYDPVVRKIVIPGKLHKEIFYLLKSMGIDNRRIYPGLDGLSKDLANDFRFAI